MFRQEKPVLKSTQTRSYTSDALLTVAAFTLFLFVRSFLGAVVFERVKKYKQEYGTHSSSVDTLMAYRFGLDYMLPKYMAEFMKPAKPVVLTPSAGYVHKFVTNSSAFCLINPIYMFYMNSEVQIVSVDHADYRKANCTVLIGQDGQCYPMKINTTEELESIASLFKSNMPYQPARQ